MQCRNPPPNKKADSGPQVDVLATLVIPGEPDELVVARLPLSAAQRLGHEVMRNAA